MTRQNLARVAVLSLLVICIAFFLVRGRDPLLHTHHIGPQFRQIVGKHPYLAPAIFVAVYILLATLALPVLGLEFLAGYGFGLGMGILWCQIAATLAAPLTLCLSHWLAADWYKGKIESRLPTLRGLSERLNHNGLLVVMVVRLLHIAPFGLSNYAFGLFDISVAQIALGTLLGNIVTTTLTVTLGADRHLLTHWRYWAILGLVNFLLLTPLFLRYLRPQWFKKIGVE
jgi:uncharacterized membrane protein YdjX (TVP38/TMEM64 family)